ncbi:uncharacterized protein [Nicotiana tomentosiformis]|uniref:uncharacterized protein n=1 Tax=Nicotiana tomentosiformis TaxID=4098 RepID=UPI00388C82DC
MAPYEALYRRQCHSPVGLFEPGEAKLLGMDLVRDALEKVKLIQDRLRTAQSRHKSYTDWKINDVAFMVGERVLLHVLQVKGVMRFGKKDITSVQFDKDLSYVEESVAILDRKVRMLRSKSIASLKVQWRGQPVKKAT